MTIDPQCAKMDDKIGCTCALQNGGSIGIRHGRMEWWFGRGNAATVQKCMYDNGGNK